MTLAAIPFHRPLAVNRLLSLLHRVQLIIQAFHEKWDITYPGSPDDLINDQIESIDVRLESRREILTNQFIAMETALT